MTSRFDRKLDRRSFGEPLSALRSVKIVDNGDPLVDLRDIYPHLPLRPGILPFLRATVAAMVNEAHRALPEGYTLSIRSCLRTLEMQRETRARITKDVVEKHPEWSTATLNRMLNRVIAPPDDISPPPHTTGGAVDVGIVGPDGQDLDFSAPLEGWAAAPTYTPGLSETAKANRLLVVHAMEHAGLTNYAGEWWHWSYGDQGWALRVGSPTAHYGVIILEDAENRKVPDPPKEEEPEPAKS